MAEAVVRCTRRAVADSALLVVAAQFEARRVGCHVESFVRRGHIARNMRREWSAVTAAKRDGLIRVQWIARRKFGVS